MHILGIDQQDLRLYTKEEYERQFPTVFADRAAEHFNQRTLRMVSDIKSKRLEVMNGTERTRKEGSIKRTSLQDETSSLIEREKKKMEQIKKKQQQEIEQLMEHELKMQEIRERNEEKMNKQHERELKHKAEVDKKKQEQELQKQLMEEKKQAAAQPSLPATAVSAATDFLKPTNCLSWCLSGMNRVSK